MTYKVNKSISAKENLYALIQYTWPEHAGVLNEDNITLTRGEVTDPVTGTTSLTISASSPLVTGNTEVTYTVANLENLSVGELIALDAADAVQLVSTIVNNNIPCLPSEVVVGDLINTDGGWTISLSATEGALTVTGSTELAITEESGTEEHLVLRSQGDIDLNAPIGSILYSIDDKETWNENTSADFTVSLPSEVESTVYIKSNDDVEITSGLTVSATTTNTDNFKGVESWWMSSRPIRLNVQDNPFYVPEAAPSNITDMMGMFAGATSFNSDISQWDTSNVTNMMVMFNSATSFNQDLSQWNVSNITDMMGMFGGASAFNSDISQWDVSNVTNMSYVFSGATSFNQDLSQWNVSNVTNMSGMFGGASAFNSDISQWDVSNVTNMYMMFSGDYTFNSDISNWNVSNVTDMSYMFNDANAFNSDISQWDTSNVTNMSNMFDRAFVFNSDISQWDVSNVTNMDGMFYYARTFDQDLSSWCVSIIPSKPNDFDIDASAWTLPRPIWGTCPPR